MPSERPTATSITRRSLLGGVGGLAVGTALPTVAADGPGLTVMTRNLYVGVDLFRLTRAADLDDLRRIAGELYADAIAHPYGARADALAAEIEAAGPDVVGVQEAALLRTREPSEFDGEHDPGATDVAVDLLERLVGALDARGLSYGVAVETVTNDVEVPAEVDGGDREIDVRLTNRTAVLVREDVETGETRSGRYDADLAIPLESVEFTLRRGYAGVDVSVGDGPVTVVTTHLEALAQGVRREQAAELRDLLPDDRPVVVTGDVNSGPDSQSGAYDTLRETFADAHEEATADVAGPTCCYDPDLRGGDAGLSQRVDVVLYRGGLEVVDARRVGVDPDARATAEVDGESIRLWPSDHAGVVASFERSAAEPIATATGTAPAEPTPSTTPTSTPDEAPDEQTGLGLLAGAGAVVAAVLARARSSESEE